MAQRKIKKNTDQRPFSMIYHDFYKSNLLDHYEKALFIALKIFSDSNNQCYPSVKKLANTTGMSKRKIQDTLKLLEQKHIISIENRSRTDGGDTSNLYTLYDYRELWQAGNSNNIAAVVDQIEEKRMIEALTAKGYIVTKEKGLVSNADQSKDTSSIKNNLFKDNNSTDTRKNQDGVTERYTLDYLKENLCYDDMLRQNPYNKDMVDTFFHYLYEAINSTKPVIRVNGEDKPKEVVVSVLSKLEYFDFLYALEKYKENTSKVNNQGAYITTLLYNAKAQGNADITNQVQHDMYGQD